MTISLSNNTNTVAATLAAWTAENPTAARFIMLALPVAIALASAALNHHPVYYMPPTGGGGGGCAPC